MNQKKVPIFQKISLFLGGGGVTGVFSLMTMFAMIFYTDVLGVNAAAVGTMIFIATVWDAINDPLCGILIDRTNTRFGKARPWLLIGGILVFVFGVLMFTVPGFSETGNLIWAYITYIGVGMAFTACVIGTVFIMPRITKDPLEQVSLSAYYNVGQSVFALVISSVVVSMLTFFSTSNPITAYRNTTLVIGGVGLLCTLIFVFTIKEQPDDAKEIKAARVPLKETLKAILHNKPFLLIALLSTINGIAIGMHNSSLVHYLIYVLGDVNLSSVVLIAIYGGTFIAGMSGKFLARFDKLRISKLSFVIVALGILLRMITRDSSVALMFTGELMVGIGGGLFTVYAIPLLIDCAEYGYHETGVRSDGLILSSLTFQTKIGKGIGAAILGFWLEFGGYDATLAVQPDSAISAIFNMHLVPYLIVAVLSLIGLCFYILNKQKMEVIAADNAAAAAADAASDPQ